MKKERLQTNKFNIGDIVKINYCDYDSDSNDDIDSHGDELRIVGIMSDSNFKVRYMMATRSSFIYEEHLELVKTHQEMEAYLDSINY